MIHVCLEGHGKGRRDIGAAAEAETIDVVFASPKPNICFGRVFESHDLHNMFSGFVRVKGEKGVELKVVMVNRFLSAVWCDDLDESIDRASKPIRLKVRDQGLPFREVDGKRVHITSTFESSIDDDGQFNFGVGFVGVVVGFFFEDFFFCWL